MAFCGFGKSLNSVNVRNGKVEIVGDNYIGGITGYSEGGNIIIQDIMIEDNVVIETNNKRQVGGIVGHIGLLDGYDVYIVDVICKNNGNIYIENKGQDNIICGLITGEIDLYDKPNSRFFIRNCFMQGKIQNKQNKELNVSVGGILGEFSGHGKLEISYCYSNVIINNNYEVLNPYLHGIGGIIGTCVDSNTNYSYLKVPVISSCIFVGEIQGENDIVGGIVGNGCKYASIDYCKMNGRLSSKGECGALVGYILELDSNWLYQLIWCYYNQAYRYIGINSSLRGINYNSYSKPKEWFSKHFNDENNEKLIAEWQSRCDNYNRYKYIKIEITGIKDNSNGVMQMSEWSFIRGNGEAYDFSGATITADQAAVSSTESLSELFDGVVQNDSDNSANKYCLRSNKVIIDINLNSEQISLDEYQTYTYYTGNDSGTNPGRSPNSWKIYFGNDEDGDGDVEYVLFDERQDVSINDGNYIKAGEWEL